MDSVAWLQAAARWVGYLGAFFVIGGAVFRFGVVRGWLRGHPGDAPIADSLAGRAARIGVLGGALLLLSAALRLWFQARSFAEPGEPVQAELVRLIVRETAWGRGWMAQLGAAVAALGGYLAAIAAPRFGWIGAGIAATLVGVAAPMTGHAVTDAAGPTGQLVDALHLLAGSAWLGTLVVVLAAALGPLARLAPAQREPIVARVIGAFSPVALIAAATAVLAGSILSWRYLGSSLPDRFGALTGTAYGQALLVKNLVLLATAGIGAWNWRIIRPRLGAPPAADRMHRSARAEIAFGLLLLAVTAVLVALPMPAEAFDTSQSP